MKRLLFLMCWLLPVICKAQCPSDKGQLELAASYGYMTANELTNDSRAIGVYTQQQTQSTGALSGTMRYFVLNRIAFGLSAGTINQSGQYHDDRNNSIITGAYRMHTTTIAFEVLYIYTFRPYFELYSFVGAGPAFITKENSLGTVLYTPASTKNDNYGALRAQCTPIGVRFGGRLGAFAEVGIGYKGLINAGVSYRFGGECWWKL